ncbi:hypothetical protein G6F46_014282 [Rhizopus delemar]|nr:hypothetical protein G6F46_014282 [Rhizopus delemar]
MRFCRATKVAFLPGVTQPEKVENVGIAHDQRRRHALRIAHRRQLLRDRLARLLRQRRALVQHRVDALAQRPHAPAFGARHLHVVLPLERVFQRQQRQEMRPAQLS